MKIPQPSHWRRSGTPAATARNRGLAIIVVLVVLTILAALLAANTKVLAGLKAEILLLEKKQVQKFSTPAVAPAGKTNLSVVPAAPGRP